MSISKPASLSLDHYGLGRVTFIISFFLFCLIFLFNLIFSPSQEFFYIYPVAFGILFSHTLNVHSPQERNKIFLVYIILLSISVFCFSLLGYMKWPLLIFAVIWSFFLLSKSLEPRYKIYTPMTGVVVIIGIVLTERGVQGIFHIALERFITIWSMGILVLAAFSLIPSSLYRRVWRKAMSQIINELINYLSAKMKEDSSYHLDAMHTHIRVVENSLNYLKKDKDYLVYQQCYKKLYQVYLGLAYLDEQNLYDEENLSHLIDSFNQIQSTIIGKKKVGILTPISSQQNSYLTKFYPLLNDYAALWDQLCH